MHSHTSPHPELRHWQLVRVITTWIRETLNFGNNHQLQISELEHTIREQKALLGGGYAGQRLRNDVIIQRHHKMATAVTITCWSTVWQVGHLTVVTC